VIYIQPNILFLCTSSISFIIFVLEPLNSRTVGNCLQAGKLSLYVINHLSQPILSVVGKLDTGLLLWFKLGHVCLSWVASNTV